MATAITILTEHLLPTEQILWHRLPIPRKPKEGEGKFIPIITGVLLLIFISPLFINSILFTLLLFIGIGLIIIGIAPAMSYSKNRDVEYIITNQRVLIYPSPYAEKNRPKIINLYEINGEIEVKYNKHNNTGSIYIPTPHWNRIANVQSRMEVGGRAIIDPDIKGINNPHKVYDILVDAIARGKTLNWQFDKD